MRLAPHTASSSPHDRSASLPSPLPFADKYDLVVVGGGPGGYVAAIKASQLGLKTACVEGRGSLGGTCLNVGCIPSKALLHSSHLYKEATKDFAAHGITINGTVDIDVPKMMANKAKAVTGLTGGIEFLFKKYKVDYIKGWGKLSGPNSVSVNLAAGGSQVVESKNILLAVGSEVSPLPTVPVDNAGKKVVDSTGALDLDKVRGKQQTRVCLFVCDFRPFHLIHPLFRCRRSSLSLAAASLGWRWGQYGAVWGPR